MLNLAKEIQTETDKKTGREKETDKPTNKQRQTQIYSKKKWFAN